MRLKRAEKNKSLTISVRCRQEDANKIKQKANIYCDGNISEYLTFAALNFVPGQEDFEDEPKRRKKK